MGGGDLFPRPLLKPPRKEKIYIKHSLDDLNPFQILQRLGLDFVSGPFFVFPSSVP